MDCDEAGGEVAVHASQSGKTWIGGIAGAVAVDQLPILSVGGTGTGAGKCGLGRDFVSQSSGVSAGASVPIATATATGRPAVERIVTTPRPGTALARRASPEMVRVR